MDPVASGRGRLGRGTGDDVRRNNPQTRANEETAAKGVEQAERCIVHDFGEFNPVDWWYERDGRLAGVAEFKRRDCTIESYPTVFLAMTKWMELLTYAHGLNVPAHYVLGFNNGVYDITLAAINPRRHMLGGNTRKDGERNDREPLIEIPMGELTKLGDVTWPDAQPKPSTERW